MLVLGGVAVAYYVVMCVIHPCHPSPVPTGSNPHWQVENPGSGVQDVAVERGVRSSNDITNDSKEKWEMGLTKTGLIEKVAERADLSKKDAGEAVEAVLWAIEGELKSFDAKLLKRPRWLVFNKADLVPQDEREKLAKAIVKKLRWKHPWYVVSAIAREGTWELALDIQRFFDEQKRAAAEAGASSA